MDLFIQNCQVAIGGQEGILLAMLVAGLVAGFTHCLGMCGPFVVAQLAPKPGNAEKTTAMTRLRGAALLPYHLGRATTYMTLGAFAAGLSQYLLAGEVQRRVSVAMLLLAGSLFLINAAPEFRRGFLPRLGIAKVVGARLGALARPFFASPTPGHRYVLGVLLGFLPCGMVMAALVAVAATGNPLSGALGMAAFAAGTVPALFAAGTGGQYVFRRWPEKVRPVAHGLMAFNGLVLFVIAGGMIL